MQDLKQYPYQIRELTKEKGGSYFITFTDFNRCISDGDTIEEATENGLDALADTIETLEELGLPVPAPSVDQYTALNSQDLTTKRRAVLDELVAQAQELNMGY